MWFVNYVKIFCKLFVKLFLHKLFLKNTIKLVSISKCFYDPFTQKFVLLIFHDILWTLLILWTFFEPWVNWSWMLRYLYWKPRWKYWLRKGFYFIAVRNFLIIDMYECQSPWRIIMQLDINISCKVTLILVGTGNLYTSCMCHYVSILGFWHTIMT